jgi:hypothetical protein
MGMMFGVLYIGLSDSSSKFPRQFTLSFNRSFK